jgi:TP901 family phage tail tape measure protein
VADNIGWATLSVIPGMTNFGAALSKGVEPQLAAAGLSGGSTFAKAFAPVAIAAAVVATGVAVTKMAADYQTATTLLVTGAGESVGAIGMVRDGLLAMAPAVGIGPTALAKAMFLVESAGYHGAAGLTVMNAAAEGAKIGGADATVVADGLTTAMTDYHFSVDQAATVTSKLVQAVALGKTNMGDLSGALSKVLPFAANLGVSFDQIMGAMSTMTGQGIAAANAATMLKFGMQSLANETPKGKDALTAIGLSAQQVYTDLGTKGLSGTLAEITGAIGTKFPAGSALATKALSDIVGGTRGLGMALALTGANAATVQADIALITNATTEADGAVKGWHLTLGDLGPQWDRLTSLASAWSIKIGNDLVPAVTAGVKGFADFAVGIAAGTGAGGKFRDVLTAVYNDAIKPVGLYLTGVGIPAIKAFVQGFKDGTGPGGDFKTFLVALYDDAVKPIGNFLVNTAIPAIQSFVKGFQDGTGPGGVFKDLLVALYTDAIKPIGDFLTNKAVPAIGAFVKGFQDGKGPGGAFRDILKQVYDDGIRPLATFITDTALPALKSIETWITDTGLPALGKLADIYTHNKDLMNDLVTFIAVVFTPALVVMTANAVKKAGEQVIAWGSTKLAGIESLASQVTSSWGIVAGWAVQSAGAVWHAGIIVAAWVSTKMEAIASALASVGSMLTMDSQWATSAIVAETQAARIDASMTSIEASFGGVAATATASGATTSGVFTAMGAGAGAMVAATLGTIGLLAGGIFVIANTWGNTERDAEYIWSQMRLGWSNTVSYINGLSWVKSLPTDAQVGAYFTGAGTWLVSAGANIIGGLSKGMQSAWNSVTSWIASAGKAIASVFNAAVGNHSPSKVFATSGANIMKGLIVGLDSMQPELDGRMGSLMSVPNVTAPNFGSGANGNAGAGAGNLGPLDLSANTIGALATAILAGAQAVSSSAVQSAATTAARDASARRTTGGWSY